METFREDFGTIVVVLACSSVLSFWITQRRINQQAEEAFRDKVRQITGMASTTRAWFSDNLDTLVPNREFKNLNQVPVVAAWRVAQKYAQDNDMTFHTPSLTPRNPKNLPDQFLAACAGKISAGPLAQGVFRTGQSGRQGGDARRAADPPHAGLSGLPWRTRWAKKARSATPRKA